MPENCCCFVQHLHAWTHLDDTICMKNGLGWLFNASNNGIARSWIFSKRRLADHLPMRTVTSMSVLSCNHASNRMDSVPIYLLFATTPAKGTMSVNLYSEHSYSTIYLEACHIINGTTSSTLTTSSCKYFALRVSSKKQRHILTRLLSYSWRCNLHARRKWSCFRYCSISTLNTGWEQMRFEWGGGCTCFLTKEGWCLGI